MRYCAFILMSSLPVAWIAVGCLLLLLAVVMAILFFLKLREVATLKKQCEDLRETMRMMRYEEASLARMLHTATKPMSQAEESVAPVVTEKIEEVAVQIETLVAADVIVETATEESTEDSTEEVVEKLEPEMPLVEAKEEESPVIVCEQEIPETSEHSPVLEILENLNSTADETEGVFAATEDVQSSVAQSHKQPINERRPAIPNDLFAAWFAENEETSEEVLAVSSAVVEAPVVETPEVEEAVVEAPVSQENMVVPAPEDSQVETPEQGIELSKEDERFCRKLERIVNSRLRNPNLNIDIIAAQFGIGRTNFYRKVRELMGMSPNDYLRKCRMERAAELLKSSEQPISEVCAQVGIPDAQYFSRVFKAYYGTAPSAYREQ